MNTGRFCTLHSIAYALVLVGALNWGLVAVGGYLGMNLNLVNLILGSWPWIERLVYLIVGISAVTMLFQQSCNSCKETPM